MPQGEQEELVFSFRVPNDMGDTCRTGSSPSFCLVEPSSLFHYSAPGRHEDLTLCQAVKRGCCSKESNSYMTKDDEWIPRPEGSWKKWWLGFHNSAAVVSQAAVWVVHFSFNPHCCPQTAVERLSEEGWWPDHPSVYGHRALWTLEGICLYPSC